MKKQRILSVFLSFCMLLGILLLPVQMVSASEGNANVLGARNGVLQILYCGQAADDEYYALFGGTGFLVGTDDNAQYAITNYHVAEAMEFASDDEVAAVYDALGLAKGSKFKKRIQVTLKRDSFITAKVIQSSKEADFAILELEQPIYGGRTPLTLADSDQLTETTPVYALGFPGKIQDVQTDSKYTYDDVTVTSGSISKLADVQLWSSPIPVITHSASINQGNSGGPLVDGNGNVVGLNSFKTDDAYAYAIKINEIRDVLDLAGIEYKSTSNVATSDAVPKQDITANIGGGDAEDADIEDTEDAEPAVEDNSQQLQSLNAVINEGAELNGMTDESVDAYNKALATAKDVYAKGADASDSEIQSAISGLKAAKAGLEEKSGLNPLIIVAIAAIAIIVIIVVVILIVSSSKKKKTVSHEGPRPSAGGYPGGAPAGGPMVNPAPVRPNPAPAPSFGDDGDMPTGILNDGSTETTVLSGSNIPPAVLLRRKNGEQITINKAVFKIGKERRKVDYCVADNSNVSRTHADIICRNNEFYIVDNNATNGTFVNGTSIAPGRERKLMNSDIIKLADEEFQFRML